MKQAKKVRLLSRAMILLTGVIVAISGVALAALQSQQNKLTGNTIQTAIANLQLSINGTTYSNSLAGFTFQNLIPGGSAVPETGHGFYLKNSGGTALSLKLAIAGPPSNPDNVDLDKVQVILTPVGAGTGSQSFTLQALLSAATSGGVTLNSGNLSSGSVQQYKLQAAMTSDAVSGSSASLGNIDFVFTGTAVST